MTLPQAIHKMTGLSATRFGLSERGVVREGAFADLVLFDADRIADQATYDNPRQMCTGIERVMVNGQWAFAQGQALPQRAGRFLSRPGRAVGA
jgi:N-acyl-D-aspartate/D-glutamate deacylase